MVRGGEGTAPLKAEVMAWVVVRGGRNVVRRRRRRGRRGVLVARGGIFGVVVAGVVGDGLEVRCWMWSSIEGYVDCGCVVRFRGCNLDVYVNGCRIWEV